MGAVRFLVNIPFGAETRPVAASGELFSWVMRDVLIALIRACSLKRIETNHLEREGSQSAKDCDYGRH